MPLSTKYSAVPLCKAAKVELLQELRSKLSKSAMQGPATTVNTAGFTLQDYHR
jgi:hypothetical protein